MHKSSKRYEDKNIGNISINRTNCNDMRLVGSTVPADTFVTLKISQGEAYSTECDKEIIRAKTGGNIVEIAMTHQQWGELISSFGIGEGVPCTIERKNGTRVEQTYKTEALDIYYGNKAKENIKNTVERFDKSFSKAKGILLNKKAISKADREVIIDGYKAISRLLNEELPFIQTLIAEDVEKQLTRAQAQFKSNMAFNINSQLEEIKTEFPSLNNLIDNYTDG